jgi:exopolysaccharide biosynthesis polyprenyl glycosylphosphotransferase
MLWGVGEQLVEVKPAVRDALSTAATGAPSRVLTGLNGEASAPDPARRGRRRGWLVRRMLVLADLVGLSLAFVAVGFVAVGLKWDVVIAVILSLPMWIVIARLYHLYDYDEERTHHPTTDDLVGVFHLVTIGTWVMFVGLAATGLAHPDLTNAVLLWGFAIAFITLARTVARAFCRRSPLYVQNTVILGAGDVGQRVARKLLRHPEYGLHLVGFVDAHPKPRHDDLGDLKLLGGPDELAAIVQEHSVERVIVAFSGDTADETLAAVRTLNDFEIQVDIIPRLFDLVSPSVRIDTLEGMPLVELPPARLPRSSQMIKRTVDLVAASVLLVLLSPLLALLALAIKVDSKGPVFFRQIRLGRAQHPFAVFKFRTMFVGSDTEAHRAYISKTMNADLAANGNGLYKLERHDAVTRVGRLLRKTSLDELPQLINVLRGDMSLVGPRPCIPYETEFFKPHQFDRFLVPAGITGLWQVTARAYATFGEALDMDVAYARGWSLGLDLRLLCRTPIAVIRGRGAA